MKNSIYWVYILHCENDTYYTGYTINIEKRYPPGMFSLSTLLVLIFIFGIGLVIGFKLNKSGNL
jgi:hypothetical protein